MNDKIIEGAVEIIKEYCKVRANCDGCRFDMDETCFFALCDLPCDWEFGGADHV